jgi:phosphoenolpyruvate carboxykinase (GTP)
MADEWEDPKGVPISAIMFGGRRASIIPLVREAFDWQHGVFLAATMSSENTAAAGGAVGKLRFDPMAMLPFCGYHMGDYFAHWLTLGRRDGAKLPKIFGVNWFRKNAHGEFLWPGYGENSRVLAWIFERCDGNANGHPTPIGLVPAPGDLDLTGLDIAPAAVTEVLRVSHAAVRAELPHIRQHLHQFGKRLPRELHAELIYLAARLTAE